jgi:hypothetical protein
LGIFPPGSIVNALIADGEDISVGDLLVSNGAGCLMEAADSNDEGAILAVALEDKDMTGSAVTAADHAQVRIL